jgi:hypothetical protein
MCLCGPLVINALTPYAPEWQRLLLRWMAYPQVKSLRSQRAMGRWQGASMAPVSLKRISQIFGHDCGRGRCSLVAELTRPGSRG